MKAPATFPNPAMAEFHVPPNVPAASLWYRFLRRICQVTFCATWQVRVFDRRYEPASGAALYISNHQSFLDPVLVGLSLSRPMNYMARDSLFRLPLFKQLIGSLNAFPVRRGQADVGALKEAMRRLRRGEQVLVFAEGTRTFDGRIGPLLPGVAMLAQRAAEWIVPVVVDGAFEAWPRGSALPRPGSIVVRYGRPISRDEARGRKPEEFIRHVRARLIAIQAAVRRRMGRPALAYD